MASDMKKPLGIVMLTKSNIREKLWPLPVDEMFGIGKKTAPYLKEAGIQTIGDVANYDNYQTLRSILGRHALLYYYKANGKDDSKVIYEDYDLKSISNSTTFLNDIDDLSSLEEEFRPLAMTVHQRAIKSRLLTNTIVITLKYSNFKSINRQMNIDHYTNSYEEIYSYAMMLLRKHYDYKPIRLIGLSINNLKKEGQINEQLSFFTEIKSDRESREVQVDDIIKQLNKNNNTHLMKASSLLKKTSS
jgi:DNA polymerase-4